MTLSLRRNKELPAGSIWYEDNEKGLKLIFTPYRKYPAKYFGENLKVRKIENNFSYSEAFYFWAGYTIVREFISAFATNQKANSRLHNFHKGIRRARGHFERGERTLSYLFRLPHPGLEGVSYGTRLFERLDKQGCIPASGNILEIGAGEGFHTEDFIRALRRRSQGRFFYSNLDLSRQLLKAQEAQSRGLLKRHYFIQADALELPFSGSQFDLVIANEVIADFPVEKVSQAKADTCRIMRKYGLDISDAPPEFLINSGSIRFLEELWRVLKTGAQAVIIEYGDLWHYPVATPLPGHVEYSIHFGHLMSAARHLGFKAECHNAFSFFQFSPSARVITGNSLMLLQRLMKYLKRGLPAFAYTEEMLKERLGRLYPRIHNLQFEGIEKLAVLFSVQEFKVLILKK